MDKITIFIKNNKTLSIILGLLGSILIGALGSGVWEYLLKPLLSYGLNLILDLSTLGIESFKNDIYLSIAEGFSEKNSLNIYNFITTLYFGFIFSIYLLLLKKSKSQKEEVTKNNEKDYPSEKRKRLYLFTFLIIFLLIITSIQNIKLQYINNSIIHYYQLTNIAAPYVSNEDIKSFNSKFSLIKNKNDYEKVINDLYIILKNNNLELKKRNIW